MKKIIYIFLVSTCILSGCHSNNTNDKINSTDNGQAADTSKMIIPQQPADTTVKDGEVTKRYPNGIIKEKGFYVKGRRRGECQSFYPNGKLWSDDYFTDGILDGPTTSYFDNGQKRYEGGYIKGKPSGTWKFYNLEGKLVRTISYDKKQNNPSI